MVTLRPRKRAEVPEPASVSVAKKRASKKAEAAKADVTNPAEVADEAANMDTGPAEETKPEEAKPANEAQPAEETQPEASKTAAAPETSKKRAAPAKKGGKKGAASKAKDADGDKEPGPESAPAEDHAKDDDKQPQAKDGGPEQDLNPKDHTAGGDETEEEKESTKEEIASKEEAAKEPAAEEMAEVKAEDKSTEEKPDEKDGEKKDGEKDIEEEPEKEAPKAKKTASDGSPDVGHVIDLADFGGAIVTHDGKTTSLKELVEQSKSGVVIFTYPKASTPGCTTQACLFRDSFTPLTATGFSIYGLSTDSAKANTAFKEKQKLPYSLLCDAKATLISAIGFKKAPKGTARGVFAVDKNGNVLARKPGSPAETIEVIKRLVEGSGSGGE